VKTHYESCRVIPIGRGAGAGELNVFVFDAKARANKSHVASLELSHFDGNEEVEGFVPFAVAPIESAKSLRDCLAEQIDTVLFYDPRSKEIHACEEGSVYRFNAKKNPPRAESAKTTTRLDDLELRKPEKKKAEKKPAAPAVDLDFVLFSAVGEGDLAEVNAAIARGASVNPARKNRTTPLHVAVKQGYVPIVKRLLDLGADVRAKDEHGYTPAWHAKSMIAHLKKLGQKPAAFEKALALLEGK
jgi:hypothetical protein